MGGPDQASGIRSWGPLGPAPRFSAGQAVWLTSESPAPRAPPPHFQGSSAWTGPPPVNRLWDPRELGRGLIPEVGAGRSKSPNPHATQGTTQEGPRLCCPAPISRRPPPSPCLCQALLPRGGSAGQRSADASQSSRRQVPSCPQLLREAAAGSHTSPHGVWLSLPLLQVPCDGPRRGRCRDAAQGQEEDGPPEAWGLGGLRGLPSSPASWL